MEKIHNLEADEKLNIAIVGAGLVSIYIVCQKVSTFD